MRDSSDWRRNFPSSTAALWLLGLAFTAVHLLAGTRYGFHRDELLTYSNARDLQWGYVVYPPLTAFLGRVELILFGTSLLGFRFFAAIACGLVTFLSGLMARSMGGSRRAIFVSAFAASIGGAVFFTGSFMSYMSFDVLWWVAVAWCVVRLLETEDPRWWLGIGLFIGLGLMTKYTIAFFAISLLIGMLLTPNRRYLRSPWFWCGLGLALLIFAPNLLWQYQHHFVGLDWMRSIHARDVGLGRGKNFLLNQFWSASNPVTVPLWLAGLWFLFARPEGNRWRLIGWMYVLTLVAFMAANARDYYLAPAYPMLIAAGAVWSEDRFASLTPSWKTRLLYYTPWSRLVIGGAVVAGLILPFAPVNSRWWRVQDTVTGQLNMQIGWPELAATVAQVRDSLPESDRAAAGIMASDEGEAGAVNLYGSAYGLPRAISGMNSNWLRGYPDPPPQVVIAVGFPPDQLDRIFASCRPAVQLSNPWGISNEIFRGTEKVYVCRNIRSPWPVFWKNFQSYG
ncbi:glycosyltransferase family 39 protein [Occallatibacter riparius]|uniref:Glycosyltransferase family 39 protein n=1 Tax=Occallatibacter riparius TaxID=1002689 RepID=A0A9J7BLT4_9BACT|nr:glycosyltransferase family 39 protein [Occallatibacter riparius]UWZ83441.1 glycosyltransferase family 39 protein [Occallatibacter riparius]